MRHPQTKSEVRFNREWQRLFNRLPHGTQQNIVCAPIGRTACELSGEVLRNMARQAALGRVLPESALERRLIGLDK